MRIRDFRADDSPQIDLVPLIDVVLCLLVFFVVTTTFDTRSVLELELPRAQGEAAQKQTTALDALGQLGYRNISIGTAPDTAAPAQAPAP